MIRQFISAEPGKKRKREDSSQGAASQEPTSPIEPPSDDDYNDGSHCAYCGTFTGLAQCYSCSPYDYILAINDDEVANIIRQVAKDTKVGRFCLSIEEDRGYAGFGDDNQQYEDDPRLMNATYLWTIRTIEDIFNEFKSKLESSGLSVVDLFPVESRGRHDDEDSDEQGSRIYEIKKKS